MDAVLETLSKKLTAEKKHKECNEKYSGLKTDEERIIFTLNLIKDYDIKLPVKSDIKNVIQSREYNDRATKLFINNPVYCDFDTIIELYTKSIAYAPGARELSLAYANRSAALFKAHLYEDCLEDCERALKLDYPDKWKAKLYARKARCLSSIANLGKSSAASSCQNTIPGSRTTISASSLLDNCSVASSVESSPHNSNTGPSAFTSTSSSLSSWPDSSSGVNLAASSAASSLGNEIAASNTAVSVCSLSSLSSVASSAGDPAASLGEKIEETLCQIRKWLPKMDLKDSGVKLVEKTLNNLQLMGQNDAAFIKFDDERDLPNIIADNKEIRGATSAVAVEYSDVFGKHVRATRDIDIGEILAINEGYATVLMLNKIYTHCAHCLKQTWSGIPCNSCVYAIYCSEQCRRNAWDSYHQIECRIVGPVINMELNHMALMALRLTVCAFNEAGDFQALKDHLAQIDSLPDLRTNGFTNNILDDRKYASVYTLARNTHERSTPDLFGRSLNASFIVYLLAKESMMFGEQFKGDFEEFISLPWVSFIGGLIMRHLQIIPSNVHSVTEDNLDQLPIDRAAALMPFYSLFNHSCNPMVDRRSFGKKIALIAISPIKKGQQIFDNYGQHYAITSKAKRQQKLLQQYHFTCSCQACAENWPLYGNYKSYQDQDLSKTVKKDISRALKKLDQYYTLASRGDVEDKPEIITDLCKMLKILYKYVDLPCTEVNNVMEILKKVYSLLGNRLQSLNSDTITTIINI
ncbi:SET and MYND domain-containing protein 4-like [Microplitis mediator]|uniref:SET and MYND domain-containing protein 4-like n=1 Tax=Microplitis mediator TaxID=375433 RepID=UPI0025543902|nr:SET and MYND domain-containing protein 4-like [Microplitis mediator]